MPNRTNTILPEQAVAKGQRIPSQVTNIFRDIQSVNIRVDRSLLANISDRDVIKLWVEAAVRDAEDVWDFAGGITFRGGEHRDRNNQVIAETQYAFPVSGQNYAAIRVTVEGLENTNIRVDMDQWVTVITHGG